MRIRWMLIKGRYELAVFDMFIHSWLSIAQVWQTSDRWTAVWNPREAQTFRTKAAAMAYIEDELAQEVMSAHARRQ